MAAGRVRRVGGAAAASQTYTLGPREAFRLDAASFTIAWAQDDGYIIPTLTARDSGGSLIANMQTPAPSLIGAGLAGFDYTGPAVFSDGYQVLSPAGYTGYALHDFGAAVTTAHLFAAWTQPPGLTAASFASWLRSAGAVTMGAGIGFATVYSSATVTATLSAGVLANHYLLLHLTMRQDFQLKLGTTPRPTATDSVGGNVLDFDNAATYGYGLQSVAQPNGIWLNSCALFYRIVNPLAIGDTVTVTLPGGAARWMDLTVHDVTGLTVGNPIGPNPGGNFVGAGVGGSVSPLDFNGTGTVPKWTGGVLINSSYRVAALGSSSVQFARGGVELETPGAVAGFTPAAYLQAAIPELHLGPFDTLTASSQNTLGIRDADVISDFLLYGIDE